MADVAFYHLSRLPLESALPKLLEKTLAAGKRAVVIASSKERVAALNAALWTYDPDSWLPHGSSEDGHSEDQPIWIATDDAAPNGAQFLFLTDGADSDRLGSFERIFDLFDGNDPSQLRAARARWKARKDQGLTLAYWQQTEQGGWVDKTPAA